MVATGTKTFLVETYVPHLDASAARAMSTRLRAAVPELQREGVAVRWLGSFAVIDDETYICMLAAGNAGDAVRANERANLHYDHVVEVIAIDP